MTRSAVSLIAGAIVGIGLLTMNAARAADDLKILISVLTSASWANPDTLPASASIKS